MLIPVCGLVRAHFSNRFRDISSYGYCASKKETYYGLKLHDLVTLDGYITDIGPTMVIVDDRDFLWELLPFTHESIALAYKGYTGN